jgi:beta-glucanase (GH16 family)
MRHHNAGKLATLIVVSLVFALAARATAAGPMVLFDGASAGAAKRLAPSSAQVSVSSDAQGATVTIQPGTEGYPGVGLNPEAAPSWDLSAYGHVEATLTNTGKETINVSLRVDNAGDWRDSPWNCESISLKPGERGTVSTIFGYSYGHRPGYALKPAAVTHLLLFTGKAEAAESFRIESISAAGPIGEAPPVDPRSVRVKPHGGLLLGPGVTIDASKQIESRGAEAAVEKVAGGDALRITFPKAGEGQFVKLTPPVGRWDMRDYLEVRLKVRNSGAAALTPRARVESNGGSTDWVSASAPLAPGTTDEIVVSFVNPRPWKAVPDAASKTGFRGEPGTGSSVSNDAVGAVDVTAANPPAGAQMTVESIQAGLPRLVLPDWLGKRPPVEGDWVKTFDDEFDGNSVDLTKWNNTGPNYWDKTSHWSKQNDIVGGGVLRMRYEKKTGRQNDEPDGKESSYAAGFLESYGKWTQRYGYFEARMKLPTAPGLWPAFWMMPDRGAQTGEQWQRSDTANGGMEFDVMEHLDRWGVLRYNIAMHWDGYGKDHKSMGSGTVYVQPDKDGFITAGLLWLPGKAAFYGNGQVVAEWEGERVCSVPMDMMFTLPMGGWDNDALDDSKLPDDFVIDYVRVWQRKDLLGQ